MVSARPKDLKEYATAATVHPTSKERLRDWLGVKFGLGQHIKIRTKIIDEMNNLIIVGKDLGGGAFEKITHGVAHGELMKLEKQYGGMVKLELIAIKGSKVVDETTGEVTAHWYPRLSSVNTFGGGGVGGAVSNCFWLAACGPTLGAFIKGTASLVEKSAGYALFMQGLVMFADFMREEAIQTSAFGVFMAKENPESYAKALQQHFQILQLVIGSRWLLWFEWTERAFSSFFIAAIGSFKIWCNSLIDMCAEKYWVFNINAVDAENKNQIPASIFFNDQYQYTTTPQNTWTPISPSTLQRKIKVTLRLDDYDDYVQYYLLEPSSSYRSIRKSLGKVTLSIIKYKEIKNYLKEGEYIKDEFRNLIKNSELINLSLINDTQSNIFMKVLVDKDNNRVGTDPTKPISTDNPAKAYYSIQGKVNAILATFKLSYDENVIATITNENCMTNGSPLESWYLGLSDTDRQSIFIKSGFSYMGSTSDSQKFKDKIKSVKEINSSEALIKNLRTKVIPILFSGHEYGTSNDLDTLVDIVVGALIVSFIDQKVDNFGDGKVIVSTIKDNSNTSSNFDSNLTNDVLNNNTSTHIPTHKTVHEDSPDIDWFNGTRFPFSLLGEGAWNCKLMKTRGGSTCNNLTISDEDDMEVNVYEEWMFTSVTDVYYLQIGTNNDGSSCLDSNGSIKDDADVWIKRDSRLNEVMPPVDIYNSINCSDTKTRWYNYGIDSSYSNVVEGPSEGKINITAFMTKRKLKEGTKYPVTIRIMNVKEATVSIGSVVQGIAKEVTGKDYSELVVYLPTDDSQYKLSITNTETNEISNEWFSFSRSAVKNKIITDSGVSVTVSNLDNIKDSEVDSKLNTILACDNKCSNDKDKFIIINSSFSPWPTKEKAIKQSGKLRIIVNCVNDAEIWIDNTYITTSGPAGTGVVVDLDYGSHTITTIYKGIEDSKYKVFKENDPIIGKYDKNYPVVIQNAYCDNSELTPKEKVKFIIDF